jgi:NOL1/NOP2/sun family putative RNA methylase
MTEVMTGVTLSPERRSPSAEAQLERYREVIPDFDVFMAANRTPEPVNLRVRTGRIDPEELTRRLERQGFVLEPVPGLPTLRKVVAGPHSVAQTLEHWLGLFQIQQTVMAIPTLALGARPGERVLDLCAAPGGKTTHLAECMEDRGCLVAIDPKEKRLRGLMSNIFRMGHTNVLVVAADGRALPTLPQFDRVLVDAPCSAEGNFRKTGGRLPRRDGTFVRYVTALQEALLRRAIALTAPGGTIVYSTCTWAPEENEGILTRVLADAPVVMEPIPLDLPHAPGLLHWNGRDFAPEVALAWRLYPHHLDSGGAFVARLRRVADGDGDGDGDRDGDGWTPIPEVFPGEDVANARVRTAVATADLRDRFGVTDGALAGLGWMVRNENVWVQTAHEWPVEAWKPHGGWRVVSLGLRAFREAGPGREHPSSSFLTHLGGLFSRGIWEPTGAELARLLAGEILPVPAPEAGAGAGAGRAQPTGPVAVRWNGQILGRAMVGRNGVELQIPRAQGARLRALLGLGTDLSS